MRHFLKKGTAALLSAVMVVTAVPQFAKEVHAAENQLPTKEQFATAEELKTFDTNDQDEKNPAKVYFGNNDQQWWIAGSQQEQGLTLFGQIRWKQNNNSILIGGKTSNIALIGTAIIQAQVVLIHQMSFQTTMEQVS